jgi:hypothetical protein
MTVTGSSGYATVDILQMSELDDAMQEHMAYLVFIERRTFSYLDFLSFEVNGKEYRMEHGTFRNKISKLKKIDQVELAYNSAPAFYTLKGVKFAKPMTRNHMGVVSSVTAVTGVINSTPPSICSIIKELPSNNNSLHDIHLKFQVPDIWTIVSSSSPSSSLSSKYRARPVSKDIALPLLNIDNLKIRTTIHRTDTVTVVVACSNAAIVTDTAGIIRLSNALTRVEERLSRIVDECGKYVAGGYESLPIPEHSTWVVTMWHFGQDGSNEYTGQKFCSTWRDGESALIRNYSKHHMDSSISTATSSSTTTIRKERLEYPNKTFADAIEEKLYFDAEGWSNPY